MYKLISVDQEKEYIPGYNPKEANNVHSLSAKKADQKLKKSLKEIKNKNITLMCGGSASGKTEFIDKYCILDDKSEFEGIIFDSTLWSINGAKIKIRNIKRFGNLPNIKFILPADLKRCFYMFNERDRKIPENRFYETHCGAREVVLWVAKTYPEINISIYYNYLMGEKQLQNISLLKERNIVESGILTFEEVIFDNREEMIEFLVEIQLSKREIYKTINE